MTDTEVDGLSIDSDAGTFPLRSEQESMWLAERIRPGSSNLNIGFAIRYRGSADAARLEDGLREVVGRHPALRLTIGMRAGRPVQTVHGEGRVDFTHERRDRWTDDELRRRGADFLGRPFDLTEGPLIRFLGMSSGSDDHVLVVAAHHIIGDMWSMALLGREMAEAYAPSEAAGQRRPSRQEGFAAFVQRERTYVSSKDGERAGAFWAEVLADPPEPPHLAAGNAVHDGAVARHSVRFDASATASLREFARQSGTTLHSTLLAGYFALLHRYSGRNDLVVGSYRANRSPRNVRTIGCFRNTVAWRVDLGNRPSLRELLCRVDDAVTSSEPYLRYPLHDVLEGLDPYGDRLWTELFSCTFQWNKTSRMIDPGLVTAITAGEGVDRADVGTMELEPFALGVGRSSVQLAVEIDDIDEQLIATFEYATDLFDAQMIDRMGRHFEAILVGGARDPDRPVAALDMLTEDELDELRSVLQSNEVDHDLDRPIHALIENRVRLHPDRVAIDAADESLTYAELDERSSLLAARMIHAGVGRGDLVGIHLEQTSALPVAVVAVLRSGAAYVALDVGAPKQRLRFVCEDADVRAIVTTKGLAAELPDIATGPVAVCIDEIDDSPEHENRSLPDGITGDDLAYVSYTSGSTGRPKGAAIEHRSAVNELLAMASRPGFGADDAMLSITGLSFDISMVELVLPLVTGGRVVVVEREVSADPEALRDRVRSSGATVVQATPTTWVTFMGADWTSIGGVRFWCGGEPLPRQLADRLLERGEEVWNLYGPTETTVWTSAWRVEADAPITVGTAIDNTAMYLLDAEQQPLPIGVAGEVHISGVGVARGYLNRPELTAQSFIPDPFDESPRARMYRTGDIGVRRSGGVVELLGRNDDQIKVRGHRIEPGEIEAALRSLDGVTEAALIARSDRVLVAFVVDDRERTPAELRRCLSPILPGYMIPDAFEQIDTLPLTPTDKVDRRALRERPLTPRAARYEPPRRGLETEMARLWERFLGVPRVGRHDDFFDLGGDSLVAVRLAVELETVTARPFPISALLEAPTLSQISGVLEAGESTEPTLTSVVAVRPSGIEQPFFYVTPFLITSLGLSALGEHIGDRCFYAVQPQGLEDNLPVHTSVEEMAAHYIEEMRVVQPVGPYAVGGHCAGSWVALEIVHQLQRSGESVNALVIVDSGPPGGPAQPIMQRARRLLRRIGYYARSGRLRDAVVWRSRVALELTLGRAAGGVTARRMARMRRAHAVAHQRYGGAPVEGDAMVVLSEQSALTEHENWRARWKAFVAGEVWLEVVPGAHSALTDPEPAVILGKIVRELIPQRPDGDTV